VPSEALRVLTWQERDSDAAQTLVAVALALHLDAVVVPAGLPWAEDAVRQLFAADVATLWAVDGVLGRAARRLGWTEALRLSAASPGTLASVIAESLHESLDEARAGVVAGVSALLVADELASDAGWLVSPDFALEALLPCYRQIAAVGDWPCAFHSDGDVRALYPALAHSGFSAVHVAAGGAGQSAAGFQAARAAGLVPMGGISARALFAEGARATGAGAAQLATGGPTVICDDGGMTSAEELAAYSSALDAARRIAG
jgi:hypothetical protein